MATGVSRLLAADIGVGLTGVGGPEPQEGQPAGTVLVGVVAKDTSICRRFHFPGDPEDVISGTVRAALEMLVEVLRSPAGASIS
jgi:nicotinamide-nucleotide amidase